MGANVSTSLLPRSRHQWPVAIVAALILATILLAHTFPPERLVAGHDAAHMYVPIKQQIATSLLGGELPVWNETVGCGVPFLANPMTQALYPGNVIFLAVDAGDGIKLFILLHLVFVAVAFRFLCGSFGVRGPAATLGGLIFMASGAVVSLHWNLLWMAGLPWLLLALALTRTTLRSDEIRKTPVVGLAVAVAMMVLACAFELLLAYGYSALAECLLCGARIWRHRGSCRRFARRLLALGGAGALAIGIAAIQLVPTFELLNEGTRSGGLSTEHAALWSAPVARLVELVAPELFGNAATGAGWSTVLRDGVSYHKPFMMGLYVGAPAIILALIGFLEIDRRIQIVVGSALVGVILLALGPATPLFELARNVLPGVDLFRYPTKLLVCAMIPLCVLGAIGVDALAGGASRSRGRVVALWSLPVLLVVVTAAFVLGRGALGDWLSPRLDAAGLAWQADDLLAKSRSALVHGSLVALAFATLSVCRFRLRPLVFIAAVGVLISLDLGWCNRQLVATCHEQALFEAPAALPSPGTLEANSDVGPKRIAEVLENEFRHFYQPYHAALHGYRSAYDYGAIALAPRAQLARALADNHDRELELSSVGIKLTAPKGREHANAIEVHELPKSLPRASLVRRAMLAPTEDAAAWYVGSLEFQPREEVVLIDAPARLATIGRGKLEGDDARANRVRLTKDEPGHVTLEVSSQHEQFLLLTDSWYPGWQTTVDGEAVPHFRANLAFRAVVVPPGQHTVDLVYRPQSVAVGTMVTIASLAIALVLFSRQPSRSRRHREVAETRNPV